MYKKWNCVFKEKHANMTIIVSELHHSKCCSVVATNYYISFNKGTEMKTHTVFITLQMIKRA